LARSAVSFLLGRTKTQRSDEGIQFWVREITSLWLANERIEIPIERTRNVHFANKQKKLSGSSKEAFRKVFAIRRLRLALTPAQKISAGLKMPSACGSVINASSYGDSYEDAFYACAWQFYDVYVFFRKAYCYKL
jgi:hypothetical protein